MHFLGVGYNLFTTSCVVMVIQTETRCVCVCVCVCARALRLEEISPLGDGLGRSKLVQLVSLNKLQPVLSQICDHSPLSVNVMH